MAPLTTGSRIAVERHRYGGRSSRTRNVTKRYVALLRGINVGGRNRVPMADLREAFETAGYSSVRTYIQSGNVLFENPPRRARPWRMSSRRCSKVDSSCRSSSWQTAPPAPEARNRRAVRIRPAARPLPLRRRLPEGPADEQTGVCASSSSARGSTRWSPVREPLLRPPERTPHQEPDEQHRRHARVSEDDDPELVHDDEVARPAGRRTPRLRRTGSLDDGRRGGDGTRTHGLFDATEAL